MTISCQKSHPVTPKDGRLSCSQINCSSRTVLWPFENSVTPCGTSQTTEHRKTEDLKDLYSLYEDTGICLTSLSSFRRSADQQNVMFNSPLILNCDWEVVSTNYSFHPFWELQMVLCIGRLGQELPTAQREYFQHMEPLGYVPHTGSVGAPCANHSFSCIRNGCLAMSLVHL